MASGIKELAKGRSDVFRLSPSDIHIRDGWNARDFSNPDNIAHVEELAASIAEVGVKKPVTVVMEDGKAYLTDGESRLRAVRLAIERGAEIATIPVMTEDRHASEADRLFTQIVGNAGKSFTPLEKADVFKRLLDFGWSESDIAKKSGCSRQHVGDMLALRSAPAEVRDAVKSGEIAPTLALQAVKKAKGDNAAAAKSITDAVANAKATGKTRATARDVGKTATGKTFKAEVREIMARVMMGGEEPTPTGTLQILAFWSDDWTRLVELAGQVTMFAVIRNKREAARYPSMVECAAFILTQGWFAPVERFGVCWQPGVEIHPVKDDDANRDRA